MDINNIKRFMNKRPGAFSLGELIIALGVIGILAMILMPLLTKAKPDENELLHKKATFIVERIVNEIATDEFLYPKGNEYSGLSNTSAVVVDGVSHGGVTKFCSLFASRLNKAANTSAACQNGQKSVTSAEGIDWYLPISDFKDNDFETIKVDVNGSKGPNCMVKNAKCYHPDQFEYKIRRGTKLPVVETGNLGATTPPPARPNMGDEPGGNTTDPRTGQNWYCIRCNTPANGTVFGFGCNKPNGHYQLVAIPSIGYKGSWFTKSVTINNADVPASECAVTFSPIVDIPKADGGTVTPPPVTPDPTPEKTYCINVTKTGGDVTQCAVAGDGCGKKRGMYVVSASGKAPYKTSWATKDVTIEDKDVNLTVICDKDPDPDPCYSITFTGDTTNCPVTPPAATCTTDKTKFTSGTYSYTVTPKAGHSYGGTTDASTKQVIVNDANVSVPIDCSMPEQKCKITGNIKEQILLESPQTIKDCQIVYSFYMTPAASKYTYITMHLKGGGSYVTSIATGKTEQTYNPSYVTLPGGVCDPVTKVTNDAGCEVDVKIMAPNDDNTDNNCSISFTGTGNLGGANISGEVQLGGASSEVVTLNKGNLYKRTLTNLACGKAYYFTPGCGKAAGGSQCLYDMSVNPVSIMKLTGNQNVNVDFKLAEQKPAQNYTITLLSEMVLGDGLVNYPETICIGGSDIVKLSGAGVFEEGASHEISTSYHGSCYYDETKYKVSFVSWNEGSNLISTSPYARINVDRNKTLTAKWKVSSINAQPSVTTKNIHIEIQYQLQSNGHNIHYRVVAIDKTSDSIITLPYNVNIQMKAFPYPYTISAKVGSSGDFGKPDISFSNVYVDSYSPTGAQLVNGISYNIVSTGGNRFTWDHNSQEDYGGY